MAYQKKEVNIVLTEEQKAFIDENWDKVKFPDLVKGTFGRDDLDGRSAESRVINEYLGEREPIPSVYRKVGDTSLTEEDKEYIRNNAIFPEQTATKMARVIFNNPRLGPLNKETRTIYEYIKTLPPEITGHDSSDEISEDYKPVTTLKQVVERVNKSVIKDFNADELNNQQKKHMDAIRSFLKAPRFLQMINSYSSKISREIFESEFIRTVFDKPDLTPDELNLCINLCWNYVHMITINRHKALLDEKYEYSMADPESKASTALADMIAAKTKELNDCDVRQQKLIADLQGKRSERHKNKLKSHLSVVDLIEWWKDEKERRKTVEREELRRKEVETELDRLESIQDVKCRILGFSREELLNG